MIVSVAQAQLFFLAMTRILAAIIHVPMLGGQIIPNQLKIGLGIVLALVLIPWQPLPPEAPSLSTLAFGLATGQEIIIGTIIGYAATLVFGAITSAGELMSMTSGFSAGRIFNPALESSGSALDQFFFLTAMLYFLVVNGHHYFILGLQRSFTLLPLNSDLPFSSFDTLLRLTADMITVGIQLALPVTGALLLADITLGLLARVAPQVQVFFLGVPLKIGLGLIVLGLSLEIILPDFLYLFRAVGQRALQMLGG